jgi:hypothetical protein
MQRRRGNPFLLRQMSNGRVVRNRSIDTAVMQLECSAWPSASNSTAVVHPTG